MAQQVNHKTGQEPNLQAPLSRHVRAQHPPTLIFWIIYQQNTCNQALTGSKINKQFIVNTLPANDSESESYEKIAA